MLGARSSHPIAAIALVLAALSASAVLASGAQAATIATSVPGYAAGPVLSGDGRVVVAQRRGKGALDLLTIDPRTGAASRLAAFPPLAGQRDFATMNLAGTGGILTATLDTYRHVSKPGTVGVPQKLTSRILSNLPSLSTLGSCAPVRSTLQEQAAGGDDFVATVGEDCALNRSTVRIHTPQGTHAIPALLGPDDRPDFAPDISDLHATGPMVAWVEMRLPITGVGPTLTLVVARGATGEVLLRTRLDDFSYGLGLAADGTVALPRLSDCSIRVVSPAAPVPRRIELPVVLCPPTSGSVAVAGGRILYPVLGGYASVDGTGSAHFVRDAAGSASPVALDGDTAYVVRVDCDADRLVAVDPSVAGAPLPLPPPSLKSCPVRRASPSRLSSTPSGRVNIALRCPAGCRGTLRLVQQRRGGRERRVATVDYAGAAGQVIVSPRIAAYARALAGCRGGLRVNAVLFPAADDRSVPAPGKGLGVYRISSRSRCRHSGGPAFKAPLPGPRP
ncbi:MAG: hypothetical protein QOI64_2039 [Solirubrobacteraceae bacterium]|jgi:hypothetical protein|nr:hypothetical protein [Solirubrobacteraceae bacterium]